MHGTQPLFRFTLDMYEAARRSILPQGTDRLVCFPGQAFFPGNLGWNNSVFDSASKLTAKSCLYSVLLNSGVATSSVPIPKAKRNSRSLSMETKLPSFSRTDCKPWMT